MSKVAYVCIEDEIEDIIYEILSQMYEGISPNNVFKIFFLRFMILKNFDTLKIQNINDLITFLIQEINLPVINSYIIYKNIPISLYYFSTNSLKNVMENIYMREYEMLCKREIDSIVWEIKKHLHEYKNDLLLFQYKALQMVNIKFNIRRVTRINLYRYPFTFPADYNEFELTFDEKLERYIATKKIKIKEKDIEDYICKHPEVFKTDVEKIIARQYYIAKDCIVDLLGENREGTKVIIEIKNKAKPKDLLYQIPKYRTEGQKFFRNNVVMMAVVPYNVDPFILQQLFADNVIVYTFTAYSINNISFTKIGR